MDSPQTTRASLQPGSAWHWSPGRRAAGKEDARALVESEEEESEEEGEWKAYEAAGELVTIPLDVRAGTQLCGVCVVVSSSSSKSPTVTSTRHFSLRAWRGAFWL